MIPGYRSVYSLVEEIERAWTGEYARALARLDATPHYLVRIPRPEWTMARLDGGPASVFDARAPYYEAGDTPVHYTQVHYKAERWAWQWSAWGLAQQVLEACDALRRSGDAAWWTPWCRLDPLPDLRDLGAMRRHLYERHSKRMERMPLSAARRVIRERREGWVGLTLNLGAAVATDEVDAQGRRAVLYCGEAPGAHSGAATVAVARALATHALRQSSTATPGIRAAGVRGG